MNLVKLLKYLEENKNQWVKVKVKHKDGGITRAEMSWKSGETIKTRETLTPHIYTEYPIIPQAKENEYEIQSA